MYIISQQLRVSNINAVSMVGHAIESHIDSLDLSRLTDIPHPTPLPRGEPNGSRERECVQRLGHRLAAQAHMAAGLSAVNAKGRLFVEFRLHLHFLFFCVRSCPPCVCSHTAFGPHHAHFSPLSVSASLGAGALRPPREPACYDPLCRMCLLLVYTTIYIQSSSKLRRL
jgi:hypothetical protein